MTLSGVYPKYIEGRFLNADCLPPEKSVTLTITSASIEVSEDPQSKGKQLLSLHFKETDRLLGLNKTNARRIAQIAGTPEVEKWEGLQITLHREMVKAFGKTVPAVRVVLPGGAQ